LRVVIEAKEKMYFYETNKIDFEITTSRGEYFCFVKNQLPKEKQKYYALFFCFHTMPSMSGMK
jgi:hypothetical protein